MTAALRLTLVMTLTEILDLRRELEARITEAVRQFEAQTQCVVEQVGIGRVDTISLSGDEKSMLTNVATTVRLP
jgi:hypothetical protein